MHKFRNSCLLILTALIWGIAFVAQSEGGDAVGAYTFNSIRSIIGGLVLIPVIMVFSRGKHRAAAQKDILASTQKNNMVDVSKSASQADDDSDWQNSSNQNQTDLKDKKFLALGGLCCGVVLFISSTLQQVGITMGTSAGKAGFLTACYIVLVPIFGIFLKRRCGLNVWVSVVLAIVGLYFLCINGAIALQTGDVLLILGAFGYAAHILIVDYFSPKVDGIKMSCIQLLICGLLGVVPMFFVDMKHSISGIMTWAPSLASWSAWIPILYAGVLSAGVGYTLQIIGQVGLNPTVASLLMSLESVFSVLAGWIILGQRLSGRELFGCALIFAAVVLAQIDVIQLVKSCRARKKM